MNKKGQALVEFVLVLPILIFILLAERTVRAKMEHCENCKCKEKHDYALLAPVLEEIASTYRGEIYVYKVDVDLCEALADAYDIRSIPTTFFIPMKGRPVKMVGAVNKQEIERLIKEI